MSSIRSGIRDNRQRGAAHAFVTERAVPGSRLSVVSAYFTTFAYDALRETLNQAASMRFLFGEPRFLREADNGGLQPPAFSFDEAGLHLDQQMRQRAAALRCADWIRDKVEVRSVKQAGLLHGKMIHVDDGRREHALVGSSNFTINGLGLGNKPNIELNLIVDGDRDREDLRAWFDELWNDPDLTSDVRGEVLEALEATYAHASPEFVYFKTLFHLFEVFLADQADADERIRRTSFEDSVVWNALFDFQKDGLRAVLAKIERHGGCILADSVGLGKTFIALAVIKWFEERNGRVLVLCPKKLRENWTDHLWVNNSPTNLLRDDGLNYTVLSHTDLTRDSGTVGLMDLSRISWGQYDLVVIDESHSFRNAGRNKSGSGRRSRYERLMEDVIRSGAKTKVLLLSATPVNNDLTDLKAQLDLISAGKDAHFSEVGVPELSKLVGLAQRQFAAWAKTGSRDADSLLAKLPPALFGLLDGLTIARSRKHIERHYADSMTAIGGFPRRAKPQSVFSAIDSAETFPPYDQVERQVSELNLALYSPLRFVHPQFRHLYDPGGNFGQGNREKYLIAMLKVGFLKRLESSVNSFQLTMGRIESRIEATLGVIATYEAGAATEASESEDDLTEEGEDEDLDEAFEVGGRLKYKLAHIDTGAWREALQWDLERVSALARAARTVTPDRDAKLGRLREIVRDKLTHPSINRAGEPNRKLILFTAYTDTAAYLYDQLEPLARELGAHAALVAGGVCKATLGKPRFQDVLANFAPRAKRRGEEPAGEIDLLIATDCISEGQNLQDADLVVNVDIHWNPVRLIQRFGRIDRIGSLNAEVRMVNFWPTDDLSPYLKLRERVEARMALVDISGTGHDNLLAELESDARWRDEQLRRLRDEVFDLEEVGGGVTLADFALDDFRADLLGFARDQQRRLAEAPLGLHAIVPSGLGDARIDPGVIFCLRRRPAEPNPDQARVNPLDPYYLVHVREDGSIRAGFGQPKPILEAWRDLSLGRNTPFDALCRAFDRETDHGDKLELYDGLIRAAVAGIGEASATRALAALAASRGGRVPDAEGQARANLDYDLITWLIIRDEGAAA